MPKPDIESGQGIVEYALILILVVIVLFVIITLLGPAILDLINEFINSVRS
ncbi:MAG: pilus assembly protein [Chloroflexota bacterium]|jgi:pilus assembly protein Flp/PilA|nr:pilus assembly protein [Chloroflexota bacterium]